MRPHHAPPRVLFVLKWRDHPYDSYSTGWGGERCDQPLSSGLFNSARFMSEMLEDAGIASKLVHVQDSNSIHRELVAFKATRVVIEAFWMIPAKLDELRRVVPHVRFIVRNHSETPFLAQEGVAFGWTADYLTKPNAVVAPNSKRMLSDTRFLASVLHPEWCDAEIDAKVPYLPNFYPTTLHPFPCKHENTVLDVGCFGAIRPLKNVVTQAIAALMFAERVGKPLHFHINAGRVEMGGAPILKNLRAIFENAPQAQLIAHDWLPHDAFRSLAAQMDLVTQATFSETFSIVSADAASQHVPLVTSSEVPWSAAFSHADPTDATSIADAMLRAWHRRGETRFYDPNLAGLRHFSAESRKIWLAYFSA